MECFECDRYDLSFGMQHPLSKICVPGRNSEAQHPTEQHVRWYRMPFDFERRVLSRVFPGVVASRDTCGGDEVVSCDRLVDCWR